MLEISGVNKSYGTRQVLTDLNFTIGDGRMTGFVGANGSGKTTTMRIILGVLAADSGRVLLDGTPLTAADRRRFGVLLGHDRLAADWIDTELAQRTLGGHVGPAAGGRHRGHLRRAGDEDRHRGLRPTA